MVTSTHKNTATSTSRDPALRAGSVAPRCARKKPTTFRAPCTHRFSIPYLPSECSGSLQKFNFSWRSACSACAIMLAALASTLPHSIWLSDRRRQTGAHLWSRLIRTPIDHNVAMLTEGDGQKTRPLIRMMMNTFGKRVLKLKVRFC